MQAMGEQGSAEGYAAARQRNCANNAMQAMGDRGPAEGDASARAQLSKQSNAESALPKLARNAKKR